MRLNIAVGEEKEFKRILIVEPHPDDGWLNLGATILDNPGTQFSVISITYAWKTTVNPTENIGKELANIKSVKTLGYNDIDYTQKGQKRYAEKYGENWADYSVVKKILCDENPKLSSAECLHDYIKLLASSVDYDCVFLPMGLAHPMHQVISQINMAIPIFYYKEYPYFTKKKNGEKFERMKSEYISAYKKYMPELFEQKNKIMKKNFSSAHFYLCYKNEFWEKMREELFHKKPDAGEYKPKSEEEKKSEEERQLKQYEEEQKDRARYLALTKKPDLEQADEFRIKWFRNFVEECDKRKRKYGKYEIINCPKEAQNVCKYAGECGKLLPVPTDFNTEKDLLSCPLGGMQFEFRGGADGKGYIG